MKMKKIKLVDITPENQIKADKLIEKYFSWKELTDKEYIFLANFINSKKTKDIKEKEREFMTNEIMDFFFNTLPDVWKTIRELRKKEKSCLTA